MAASASDNDDVAEIKTPNSAASSSHRSKQEKGEEKDEFMIIVRTRINRRLAQDSSFPLTCISRATISKKLHCFLL